MEEKMASAEETQNESELEDIRFFKGMKKYYRKDRLKTTISFSSVYKSCNKEFTTLFINEPTPIDKNQKFSCAAASPVWKENPTRDTIHTFECDRTKTKNRGFGRPNKPEYSPNLKKKRNRRRVETLQVIY